MKIIPTDSKILSISHNDCDGCVSQIILGHIYKNIKYINTSFYKIDDILYSLDYKQYDYVFLTDIHPEHEESLNVSNKIILIDHHKSAQNLHNPQKMHFVLSDDNVCAAELTKQFVEKMYSIRLTELYDLIKYTNDYDTWTLKYPKSTFLNDLMFYLYRPLKFRELFFNGRTKLTKEEVEWLKERRSEFKKLYANLNIYELDKIQGCMAESTEFINEICHKLMNEEKYNIVIIRNPRNGRVSIRHRIANLDTGKILKENGWGGGHACSSGFFSSSKEDFKMKIDKLEQIIENYINTHRIT
jgi:oligoribonuclease NrnB/cAMP/cGMP phosphodiesterase (DHH superfamily)